MNQLIAEVNKIANSLGIHEKSEKTIVKISDTDDKDKKVLELKSGSWESKDIWYIIDNDDNIHAVCSMKSLLNLINTLRVSQQQNFNLNLEKAILQEFPVDFDDVWIVAISEIQKAVQNSDDKKMLNFDLSALVKKIKQEHPNLFFDISQILSQYSGGH
ncbi:MAG: DUF2603 domain-containing protein [Campylobacterales bacterium]|nr:DUF2603 domain-containing protein [Campylobacterales bacterium]